MKTVCIVVGHSSKDGGAYNDELMMNEYDYNHVLAGHIAERLHKRNVRPIIMYRGDSYNDMVRDVNKTEADYSISLHCNGSVHKDVKGAATLYCHTSSKSKELAERVQSAVFGLMNENNRGAKPKYEGDNGWLFLRYTNMPAVLIEPFFISNTQSLELGLALRQQLGNVIADALVDHIVKELGHEIS